MTRRLLAVIGLVIACSLGVVAASTAATPAAKKKTTKTAAPFLLGIEDNAQILGNTAAVLPDITALRPDVFRFTIFWSQIAPKKPIAGAQLRRPGLRLGAGRPGRHGDDRSRTSPCC